MHSTHFDIAVIGLGAAGSHLALAMARDEFFLGKRILLLEKDTKDVNDRTWCFWEKGAGLWDELLYSTWSKGLFINGNEEKTLDLGAYSYKMLKGLDFYKHTRRILDKHNAFHSKRCEVLKVSLNKVSTIETSEGNYSADFVFDSRVTPEFTDGSADCIRLLQHFKGRVIRTEESVFDDSTFTMMDFRLKYPESTSFTYVLPFSANEALVEFTFFSPTVISEKEYDTYLDQYIDQHLGISNAMIIDEEMGVIPMSDFPFHRVNTENYTKIGTAGSWVKGSSGYSFKNAERFSKQIVENLKNGWRPDNGLFNRRFRKYDRLFLDVLFGKNHLGERIFSDMYLKNDIQQIFSFLDEETSLLEEFKIINSFEKGPFTKSLLKQLVS